MAYAIELAFDIPPAWGYLLCSLVVIPLVTHGVTWSASTSSSASRRARPPPPSRWRGCCS